MQANILTIGLFLGEIAWPWSVLIGLGLPAAAGFILWRWEKRRLARTGEGGPACDKCGYLLIGLESKRCPECGRAVERDSIEDLERLRDRLR